MKSIFRILIFSLVLVMTLTALCGCESLTSAVASSTTQAKLVINEVVTSNSLSYTHPTLSSPDWIEIYNASDSDFNLAGCGLSDNPKQPHKWVFPAVTVKAGGYLLIFASSSKSDEPLCTGFGLSRSGETLLFTDPYYNILCEVNIPALKQDISYACRADGTYGFCAFPTPGEKNSDDIADSLDELVYVSGDGALILSEVMPNNSGSIVAADGRRYPWAEIKNTSAEAANIKDYWLSDDELNTCKWQLPDMILQPNGYAIVFFSGLDQSDGELHASFRLGSEDNTLLLSNIEGEVISHLSWNVAVSDNVSVIATDGENKYTGEATPGTDNPAAAYSEFSVTQMDDSDPVRISEVLPKNRYSLMDSDGDRSEWAELYNSSDQPVSLLGYYLSDNPNNPCKWAFPDIAIQPSEYLIVFLSSKNRTTGELHASFSLSDNDEALILTNMNALKADTLPLTSGIAQNISIGHGSGGGVVYYAQPTPGSQNTSTPLDVMPTGYSPDSNGVYINEVCAASQIKSGKADWIELYNGGESTVDLDGWHLSDSMSEPQKHIFSDVKLESGEYLLIRATTRTSKETDNSAPFGISEGGETLILTDTEGSIVDCFDTGALRAGLSSGRANDGSMRRVFFREQTPGAKNSDKTYDSYAAMPLFSRNTLYAQDSFELSMTCTTDGATIRYTLDGSMPSTESSAYSQPLNITKNTVVRAAAYCDGLLASDVNTQTFLFEKPHTLPVVTLCGDPAEIQELYAVEDRWQKIENPGYFEYYDTNGGCSVKFPCGLRVSGASSLLYAQKSLSVSLRTGYGRGSVTYPFFDDYDITTFSCLTLRNSGQDRSLMRMRDSYFNRAVEGLNIDNIATRPVIMYLNGVYYGIYDLNENQNESYLESHYGVDPDSVSIIRRNTTRLAGSNSDFKRIRAFALDGDISLTENYNKLCEWVDEDYFIDYLIAQTYFANGDMFNQKYWGTSDYAVKWRPVYFDLDYALRECNPTRNLLPSYFTYEGIPSQDGSLTNMDVFYGLNKNAEWRDKFCARYVYVVKNHFQPERLVALLNEMADALRPEMERHIKKWHYPSSMDKWQDSIDDLAKCLKERPDKALLNLKRYYDISDSKMQEYIAAAEAGAGIQ